MKRICLVIFSCIILAHTPAFAGGKGGIGIKGGISLSTIGFEKESAKDQKNRFRIGGTGGFSYEVATPGFFAFEVEALYDLRGTKEKVELASQEIIQKNYLHYLHFPASLKFYIGDNFNLNVGGYGAYLAGGKAQVTTRNLITGIKTESDFKLTGEDAKDIQGNDYLKRYDAGVQAGLEFIFNNGIGVGARFSKGLVDITNDEHNQGGGNALTTEIGIFAIIRL